MTYTLTTSHSLILNTINHVCPLKSKPAAPQYPITGIGNIEGENSSTDYLNTQPQCLAVERK